jgi:hypothetical protein
MQTRLPNPALFIVALLLPFSVPAAPLPELEKRSGPVASETVMLRGLDKEHQYSLLYSLSSLEGMGPEARVTVEVVQNNAVLASKTLHAGDPDFYTQFRVPQAGEAAIRVKGQAAAGTYSLQVNRWPLSSAVRSGPIHQWQNAMHIQLGTTVFGSGDDAAYIPVPGTPRSAIAGEESRTDWYRFEFRADSPKLVFFQVELTERDQIPVNVTVHRLQNGRLEEYFEGEDPVTLPHEVQALPGNKFTPRLLKEQGTYYIAVRANHPEYKLRTRVYDPPPYSDPQKAVRTALDYILAAGDSWHANTPRRGGLLDRVSSVHQETSLCVACHATHFPQRAQLYASRNGYPVVNRQQLQFLTERFYNNPRPFYGFEEQGAVWARMISASANVLSRMSHLMSIFEDEITGEPRESFHRGIAGYLKLYYAGREKLPPDETNGNTPLVSAHEVAWYSWSVTKDPRIPDFIANGEVKNTIDLCYQTLALADIGRERFREQIQKNAERILELQRPDGQWSARFEPTQPAVEFQTGHALWALQAAGVPASDPRVAKAIRYLLSRQQPFGGWMDPLQSFENFRTPFRETQMAVLALSAYFPKDGRAKGWNSPKIDELSADPAQLLQQLDEVWDAPSPAVLKQIVEAARSNDALIRQAAVEALGRLGHAPDSRLLGDSSKMVQRTAAWAMRQAHVRRENLPVTDLAEALTSDDDRTRWGATRIFAAHFSALAKHGELARALGRLATSEIVPLIRMDAVKGLWQFWFWSADANTKSAIEDTLIAALAKPQHPWIEQNLHHAAYNLADENIRYLYNNWVPLLGQEQDRHTVIRGRLAVEEQLAAKFAKVLESGSEQHKKQLLQALTELPLRRGDVYDLEADMSKMPPPTYNRIGNDTEQIAFFGESADRFARALEPLLDSPDPEMRTLASRGVLLVRETRFADVNRLAGPPGENTRAVLAKVQSMPDAVEVAHALKPPVRSAAVADSKGSARVKPKLDETYFRGYVQPILEKRGKDGYACVHCHASHTLFNGSYSTALNVVNPAEPEQSLILLKPTSSSETEGIAGASTVAHGGGVRWTKDSPEYVTILEWIKGAKE